MSRSAVLLLLTSLFSAAWLTPRAAGSPFGPPASEQAPIVTTDPEPVRPYLKAAAGERTAIEGLLGSLAWPRRVISILRLQRFDCPESAAMVADALHDPRVAVRCFAVLVLAHRNVPQSADWFERESDPEVIRTALRAGYRIDPERLARGVTALSRSSRLEDKMLAAELGLLADDDELEELATELVRTIILRMGKEESGALSPRLARITGGDDLRLDYRWRLWYQKNRGLRSLDGARLLPPRADETVATSRPTPSHPDDLSEIARLPLEEFTDLSDHLEALALEPIDLAIVMDCTASMSGEIADAQGGIDDLMRFVGDVSAGVRVGIAGYRDRREKFEKIGWDLTPSIDAARRNLWRLSAEGGGDRPELVNEGLGLAYGSFSWNPHHRGVLVLVGDAPPHPGRGEACVKMATAARVRGVTTHVVGCDPTIEDDDEPGADDEENLDTPAADGPNGIKGVSRRRWGRNRDAIEFFPEIAAAGGGRVVNLARDERLVPEIAGLIVGVDFEKPMIEFFEVYMELCR
ncbi:MAG: VWA domain-containing protein [Phycisphaeraceae bacterium]|nr:VWA domain-containing protein [Phycisphaeraceae bacterium]